MALSAQPDVALASARSRRRRMVLSNVGLLWVCSAVAIPFGAVSSDASSCSGDVECQAKLLGVLKDLRTTREEVKGKHHTLRSLEAIRSGLLAGQRIEIPSAQRQYLETGVPLLSEISFDARHKPVTTNVSRHISSLQSIAPETEVKFHSFMQLKRSTSTGKGGSTALLVIVDRMSKLSVYTTEGEVLLSQFDLGHGPERVVTHLALSPNQENHFVLSGDDLGNLRVHNLKVVTKREKKATEDGSNEMDASSAASVGGVDVEEAPIKEVDDGQENRQKLPQPPVPRQLIVTTNFSCAFTLPQGAAGDVRRLNSVVPIDRGSQTYFVTGDSSGGITVFYRNGTIKGRVRVSDDHGGVIGLLRGQGQNVLFYSSHAFGFFSVTQVDVQHPPCTGWSSPLFDIAVDPSLSYSRIVLSLASGDVVVFSTSRGKSKACDLTLKFPHVSALPLKLHIMKGHVLGMPLPVEASHMEHVRELFFFDMAAIEAGYGVAPSRSVVLQVSFKPKQPAAFAVYSPSGGSPVAAGEKTKTQIALRFENQSGLDVFEVTLKQSASKSGGGGGSGTFGGSASSDGSSWLNWFPKIGVFGIALIGVVIWNVRKVTAQRRHDRMDDIEDDYLKERLRERKLKKAAETDKKDEPRTGGFAGGAAASSSSGAASSSMPTSPPKED
eukprot:TRINITY_DN20801_c0_g1_i1.p1 TRINITY_DN20801_c0_g1~~TRINITY_DN20801_c0_g1_i1.p1  ORF type:complete len:703 (+),score=134.73 TRINITY_DN20801_c0_g1_i1:112-2109(+)